MRLPEWKTMFLNRKFCRSEGTKSPARSQGQAASFTQRSDVKVTKRHLEAEKKYLEGVLAVIDRQGSVADHALHERWKEVGEFKKYLWERGREMDLAELAENRRSVNLE